jgi:plastocyanin
MSIRNRLVLVLTGAFVLALIFAACAGGPSTTDIVQTSVALNKVENATATAEIVLTAGGNPDEVEVEIGTGSVAEAHNIAAAETATAEAAEGIFAEGVGSDAEVKQGQAFEVDVPDGPAETGVIVVDIVLRGAEGMVFDPDIVKIELGSTVKWTNSRRSASSSAADPGQDDSWDSGSFSKGTFDTEAASFKHTFNIPGCFTYKSLFSGDTATGAICVVVE